MATKLNTGVVNKFLDRELTRIQQVPYKQPMAPLNAERIFGFDADGVTEGHQQHNQLVEVIFGTSQWISAKAKDLPRVDGGLIEDLYPVHHHGCSYGYDYFEASAAMTAGRDLNAFKVRAAERATALKNNRVAFFGDLELGLRGALTHDYIPRLSLPLALFRPGNTDVNATLAALYLLGDTVRRLSEDAHTPNLYTFDSETDDYLRQTRLDNTTGDRTTIMEAFLANVAKPEDGRQIRVERAREQNSAGPDGEPLLGAWSDLQESDARGFVNVLPVPFRQHEAQVQGLERITPVTSTTGGWKTPYPMAHAIGELR